LISLALGFASVLALYLLVNMLAGLVRARRLQFACNAVLLALLCVGAFLLASGTATYFGAVSANPFSAMFALVFTLTVFLANLLAYDQPQGYTEFMLLGSFALVGSYIVAFSNSLITVLLGIEAVAIPSAFIFLVSKKQSAGSAARFFIMSSLSVALLSFAAVLVYGSSGTLALAAHPQSTILLLAAAMFVAALGFGAMIFPFNASVAEVYQGISAHAASMLGGLYSKVSLAALILVFVLVFMPSGLAFKAIAVLSALTMFSGSLLAAGQSSLKKLLAHSSVAQAGFVLIGIATQNAAGLGASSVLIFADVFSFMGMLGIIAWLERGNRNRVDDLVGLYKENRFAAVALSIFLLSLIGMPFTIGFIGKFLVLLGAANSGLLWLAVVGVVNVAISAFYCARVITAIYASRTGGKRVRLGAATACAVVICLCATIALGIYPQPVMSVANSGAGYLFGLVAH
jgi:NADH-quinone oxidoreductase subunit N